MAEPGSSDTASSHVTQATQEGVTATDMLVKGNGPAFLQNLAYQNAVAQQAAFAQDLLMQGAVNRAMTVKAVDHLFNLSPEEGAAPSGIAEIIAKIAAATPRETGGA